MLLSINDLEGYAIEATDGDIGRVCDALFDDQSWAVRYLVVETGSWLKSRKVLISPAALGCADRPNRMLPVSINREQVRSSPDIDTERPVTRQHEIGYLEYYQYPRYWSGPALWGTLECPRMLMDGRGGFICVPQVADGEREDADARNEMLQGRHEDPHLRSCKAIGKYTIDAADGGIGHLHGMLIEERSWALRYIVVRTGAWWTGHDVLVAPNWIRAIDWFGCAITVDLSREQVRQSPPFESTEALDRPRETELFDHYGRPAYWAPGAAKSSQAFGGTVEPEALASHRSFETTALIARAIPIED
jgi:hypothetical protein